MGGVRGDLALESVRERGGRPLSSARSLRAVELVETSRWRVVGGGGGRENGNHESIW